jgi:hypothetical protein
VLFSSLRVVFFTSCCFLHFVLFSSLRAVFFTWCFFPSLGVFFHLALFFLWAFLLTICLVCIVVILCVFVVSYVYCCALYVFVVPYVYLYYACVGILTLDAGLLVRSQYPVGSATGHLDTGFSWFPCVYKPMLRRFPSFQVATTCLLCSPPDFNSLVTFFPHICVHVK